MNTQEWIYQLLLGGIVGMLGQGIRVVTGLKKLNDQMTREGKSFGQLFEVASLLISLLIGFVAGALAVLGLSDGKQPLVPDKGTIVTLIATGYAGTDFIEGFVKKYLPSGDTEGKAGTSAATEHPAVG